MGTLGEESPWAKEMNYMVFQILSKASGKTKDSELSAALQWRCQPRGGRMEIAAPHGLAPSDKQN